MDADTEPTIPPLKPCPFCGKAARITAEDNDGTRYIALGCQATGCLGVPRAAHRVMFLSQMVKDWNTRAELPCEHRIIRVMRVPPGEKPYECTDCGKRFASR